LEVTAVRGFKDILPDEIGKWQFVEATVRQVFESYGFSEMRIPILEKTELFARGIGEATDIVEKEMYTFSDRSGTSLTLRPEATASMVRALVETGLYAREPVAKLYVMGPMFRYERPQKGRFRQFNQIDAEVFGVEDPMVDAEVMVMLIHFLQEVGLRRLELQVNSLGCRTCRPSYHRDLKEFLMEHEGAFCLDCRRRIHTNPLRIFDCKVESCKEIMTRAPLITDSLGPECQDHFDAVLSYLKALKIFYRVNPKMVRGLDYYVRTAFEVVSRDLGAQNAVAGGGRYDGLSADLGGPEIPGIGFAIGMERLISLLPPDVWTRKAVSLFVATIGEKPQAKGFAIANALRLKGLRVETGYERKSLKSQMRRADKLVCRYVLILGEEELEKGKAVLRDMTAKSQEELDLGLVQEILEERLR
jgi:histidyl-tRNA synthetase